MSAWIAMPLLAGALMALVWAIRRQQQLQQQLLELSTECTRAQTLCQQLQQGEQQWQHRLRSAEQELSTQQQTVSELKQEKSAWQTREQQLRELPAQIRQLESDLEQQRKLHQQAIADSHTAKAQVAAAEHAQHEFKQRLDEQRAAMKAEFEQLAQRLFEEKGAKFSQQSQLQLDAVLAPFKEQLQQFKTTVELNTVNDKTGRAELSVELKQLRDLNQQINRDAQNLTQALKGDRKQQGNWGEMLLETLLERAGLRKGQEYDTQEGFRNEDGRLLKPDVILHLPDNKDIVIDSKVSLQNWADYNSADSDENRAAALAAMMRSMRAHVNGLAAKEYTQLLGVRTLEFVFLFVPIEPALMTVIQHDDSLFVDAFDKRIVIVSPSTLLATLRTVASIWRYERQNENARAIADRAGKLYDKLRGFVEYMEKLRDQIHTVQNTYDKAMNSFCEGNGNAIRQAEQLRELGAKVARVMPKNVLEKAGLEWQEETTVTDKD